MWIQASLICCQRIRSEIIQYRFPENRCHIYVVTARESHRQCDSLALQKLKECNDLQQARPIPCRSLHDQWLRWASLDRMSKKKKKTIYKGARSTQAAYSLLSHQRETIEVHKDNGDELLAIVPVIVDNQNCYANGNRPSSTLRMLLEHFAPHTHAGGRTNVGSGHAEPALLPLVHAVSKTSCTVLMCMS